MSVHLNDLSKVYLNNVFESKNEKDDDESKMKKSHKKNDEEDDNEKEDEENEDQPRWQDSDRDGKWYEPGEDVAAPKKKKVTKESFSNWREDLKEIVQDKKDKTAPIKEKTVDNYKDKTIVINPDISEHIQILESVELSEEYVDQIIDLASQYFYSEGYDEESVKIIAEGMGHDEFVDFIFDIGNTFFLDEAAYQGELLTSTGKARKNPKVSAAKGASTPVANTRLSAEKKKPEEKKSSPGQLSINYDKKPSPPGQERIKQAVGNAVKSATSQQTRQAVGKAAGSAVKSAANTAARAALSAWKGHKAAMKRKGEGATVAQQVGAGLGAAAGAFFKKGKEHLKNSYEFADWLEYIVSEGCDISEWTINNLYKQYKLNEAVYNNLNEKAESEQQQKLFGLALSVKRGQTPRSEASAEVLKIVDSMSEKKIRDFAKTKHEGIPKKKVEEQLEPTTPDQITAQKRIALAQDLLNKANKKALNKKVVTSVKESTLVDESTPTKLFYKLQKAGKGGSKTATAQRKTDADLETQKNLKMKVQQSKQRYEREPEEDHPSLSARERNPNLR
jgi:hypothetical protein